MTNSKAHVKRKEWIAYFPKVAVGLLRCALAVGACGLKLRFDTLPELFLIMPLFQYRPLFSLRDSAWALPERLS